MVMEQIFKIAVCLYVAFCWQFAYRYIKEEDADLDLKTPIPTSTVILEVVIALVSGWCVVPLVLGKYLAMMTYDRFNTKNKDSKKVSKK